MRMQSKSSDDQKQTSDKSDKILNKKAFDNDSEEEAQTLQEKELVSYLDDPKELSDSHLLPDSIRRKWTRVAFWLSLMSAVVSLAFSLASFILCKDTDSSSIFANAFDAFLGTVSSLAVAWRFRDELNGGTISNQRERIATFGIGLSFIATGIAIVAASIVHLTETSHPKKTQEMFIILWCSLGAFFLLAYAQRCLAHKLNSQSMWAASVDSAMAAAMSFGIGISTLIYRTFPKELWWLDHAVAIVLGILSGGYGIHLLSIVVLCNEEVLDNKAIDYEKVPLQ